MDKEQSIPSVNLNSLLEYMHERQRIYLRRTAREPRPWTDDPILRNYRLENVYRELDRQSKWLRENWREPYADHPNLWFACCMFRMINWNPTLAEIGFPERWQPWRVLAVMQLRMARGEKVYTSAYRIHQRGEKIKAKHTVAILNELWTAVAGGNRPTWETEQPVSLESAHSWLMQFPEWGGFLAYEAITDLRHTRYLRSARDIYTWANPGPGAARGICRLLGVDLKTTIPRDRQIAFIREVFEWVKKHRDAKILPTLEMRDVEHSLCAFDKWRRAHERLQAGKPTGLERFHPIRRNLFGEVVPQRRRRQRRAKAGGVRAVVGRGCDR
jgi:hypothetical protein